MPGGRGGGGGGGGGGERKKKRTVGLRMPSTSCDACQIVSNAAGLEFAA